jgi:hypothetical protein
MKLHVNLLVQFNLNAYACGCNAFILLITSSCSCSLLCTSICILMASFTLRSWFMLLPIMPEEDAAFLCISIAAASLTECSLNSLCGCFPNLNFCS